MRSFFHLVLAIALSTLLASCSTPIKKDGPPRFTVDVSKIPDAKPKYEAKSKYGNPKSYMALGKRYYVLPSAKHYDERGIASWYGRKFHRSLTSTREPYNMLAMTAASPILPIPCYVRVTNLENGKAVTVRVNDRGPFAANRIIDLSYAAAKKLGYANKGTALVEVKAINLQNPDMTPSTVLAKNPRLYLQVGAFAYENNASNLKEKLSHFITNRPIRISESEPQHNAARYRVQIGPLNDVEDSDRVYGILQEHGLKTAITVIR